MRRFNRGARKMSRLAMFAAFMLATPAIAGAAELVRLGFSEGSGTTTANAGTLGGTATIQSPGAWLADGPGSLGAIDFGTGNGYDKGVVLGTGTALQSLTQFTVTTWVKTNAATPNDGGFNSMWNFSNNAGDGSSGQNLWVQDDLKFNGHTGSADHAGGTWSDRIGTWQFVAFSFNAGAASIYVGDETTAAAFNVTLTGLLSPSKSTPTQVEIGGSSQGWGVQGFPAAFGDFRIYDTALTGSQVEGIRAEAVAVPEPASIASLCLAGLLVLCRRRHA